MSLYMFKVCDLTFRGRTSGHIGIARLSALFIPVAYCYKILL